MPIGLDHRYRITNMPGARPIGMRGAWVTDDTFSIDFVNLGEFVEQTVDIKSNGDEVPITVLIENFDGEPLHVVGKAAE
jgi:hypothetical protein